MLFAIALAQKLGVKYNLQAFSLHSGCISTKLDRHVDWSLEMKEYCVGRSLGNREGWGYGFGAEPLQKRRCDSRLCGV
ncbi:putative short-chain dehydrogenase [Aspergillus homomorphus CBS 101889]|uniref:Uncharacterized protein n=1 Tax=Aspergillus homomorphus (strain CBS 101889) TaxID=1450537 RepID=A0A395HP78_ASPHC|nr:hypothetical protein BO97DRAFT_170023 [Aspergillus homomorphus CBS 101889]RAL09233.1 hypothetical protein BO97DRAFT_170023 [Aspergillus homomorphus CBS 101889]